MCLVHVKTSKVHSELSATNLPVTLSSLEISSHKNVCSWDRHIKLQCVEHHAFLHDMEKKRLQLYTKCRPKFTNYSY